jgi:hypothetical protein
MSHHSEKLPHHLGHSRLSIRHALGLTILLVNRGSTSRSKAQRRVAKNPLNVACWAHTASLPANGTLLIAGGMVDYFSGASVNTNACEPYGYLSGTPEPTTPMQHYRDSHRATLMTNGQVLVAARFDDNSGQSRSRVETYRLDPGTWTNTASMPHAGRRLQRCCSSMAGR